MFRDLRRSLRRRSDRNIWRGKSTRSPVLRSCTAAGVKGGGDPAPHYVSPLPLGSPHYGQCAGKAVRDD